MNEIKARIALRYQGLYIPEKGKEPAKMPTLAMVKLAELGYRGSKELLETLASLPHEAQMAAIAPLEDALGIHRNWTPLINRWNQRTPEQTEEGFMIAALASFVQERAPSAPMYIKTDEMPEQMPLTGTQMPCGHFIPDMCFDIEAYNGCPLCGTPFIFDELQLSMQASKFKTLQAFDDQALATILSALLSALTPLEGTDLDSVRQLLKVYPLPEMDIPSKETAMLAIQALVDAGKGHEANRLFRSPADIVRYLWFSVSGSVRVMRPQTAIKDAAMRQDMALKKNGKLPSASAVAEETRKKLKIKLSRSQGKQIALWIEQLPMSAHAYCEYMHPQRGQWVRIIRAARLVEWSKKAQFPRLGEILRLFHSEEYTVLQARIDEAKSKKDLPAVLKLLQQEPGLFARSLVATLFWAELDERVLDAFYEIMPKLPKRLLFTLAMRARKLFQNSSRSVQIITGHRKVVPAHPALQKLSGRDCACIAEALEERILKFISKGFEGAWTKGEQVFIHPFLEGLPIPIGDRSATIQDLSTIPNGTAFPIMGNPRFYMHWGYGLPAQHFDMDLHAVAVAKNGTQHHCYYGHLSVGKALLHSGDIRKIPDDIGTAEYIQVNVQEAKNAHLKHILFYCNAYNQSSLTGGLKVGWMDSANTMTVSESGVAYDPSCVQHEVMVKSNVSKGLLFAALDIENGKINYMEMPFHTFNINEMATLYGGIASKFSVGYLLRLKAEANQAVLVKEPWQAQRSFDLAWANIGNISAELLQM